MPSTDPTAKFDYNTLPKFLFPLIVLMGLAVRIPGISDSFYGDEMFSVFRDSSQWLTPTEDRFRPAFFSLLYFWRQLGFSGEAGLRLLPLLFGLLQIPLAFWIGKLLNSNRIAVTFSVLVAASPMLIEFSQELRMYSMIACIALLQVALFLKILQAYSQAQTDSNKVWLWSGFIVVALLGVYTHLHYWLFLAGLSLSFFRKRKIVSLKISLLVFGIIVLFYLPNAQNIIRFQEVRGREYAMDLISAIPKLLVAFTVGFNYFSVPEQGLERAVRFSDLATNLFLAGLVAIPAIIFLWRFSRIHFEQGPKESLWLSHELFTLPLVLGFLAAVVTGKNFLQPKYMIFSAPILLLLITKLYLSIQHNPLRKIVTAFAVIIFIIAIVHFNQPQKYGRREDWKRAAQLLKSNLNLNSSVILLGNSYPFLDYYAPDIHPYWQNVNLTSYTADYREFLPELRKLVSDKQEVYYLRYDIIQNQVDKRDAVLNAARNLLANEKVTVLNPRLLLYHWKVPPQN